MPRRALRPGLAGVDDAARRGGRLARDRRRRAQPDEVGRQHAGRQREARRSGGQRDRRACSGRAAASPASSAAMSPSARRRSAAPPTVPARSPQRERSAPARGTCARGTPAPSISPIPTARRWRITPGVPGGKPASRISSRKRRRADRARQASRSRRRPRGSVASPRRTARRPPHALARRGRAAARASSRGRGSVHSIQAGRPGSNEPIHGARRAVERARGARAGPALEAPGRLEASARRRRPARSIAESGAPAAIVAQPSAVQLARGGR